MPLPVSVTWRSLGAWGVRASHHLPIAEMTIFHRGPLVGFEGKGFRDWKRGFTFNLAQRTEVAGLDTSVLPFVGYWKHVLIFGGGENRNGRASERRLPQLLNLAPPKSGTTDLYRRLLGLAQVVPGKAEKSKLCGARPQWWCEKEGPTCKTKAPLSRTLPFSDFACAESASGGRKGHQEIFFQNTMISSLN